MLQIDSQLVTYSKRTYRILRLWVIKNYFHNLHLSKKLS